MYDYNTKLALELTYVLIKKLRVTLQIKVSPHCNLVINSLEAKLN